MNLQKLGRRYAHWCRSGALMLVATAFCLQDVAAEEDTSYLNHYMVGPMHADLADDVAAAGGVVLKEYPEINLVRAEPQMLTLAFGVF